MFLLNVNINSCLAFLEFELRNGRNSQGYIETDLGGKKSFDQLQNVTHSENFSTQGLCDPWEITGP